MEVLIIGLGSIAAKHITALRTINPDTKIFALRSVGNSEEVDGIANIYDLEGISPDFAIISNPTDLHYASIKKMAQLKIPMLVEKPVLANLTEAEQLTELITVNGVFTHVACNLRFHPCLQFLKQYIDSGIQQVNEVNIYCGSYLPDWRPNRNFREIYSVDPSRGGGVHLDLFHEIDYAVWIFGKPNNSRGYRSNSSTLNIEASDYANYLLSYSQFNISIVLNYFRRKPKRSIEILFENETWYVDLIAGSITNDSNEKVFEAPSYNIINSYKEQMCFFIESLKTKQDTGNTVGDSINVLQISLKNESFTG